MTWETFTPGLGAKRPIEGHVISINSAAGAVLSKDLFSAMGSPAAVELMWDDDTRRIGVRPAEYTRNTYRVNPRSRLFYLGSLLDSHGLALRGRRVNVENVDGIWAFSVDGAS